jgi:transcriptional regulator of acetoin/glycerol metabolism
MNTPASVALWDSVEKAALLQVIEHGRWQMTCTAGRLGVSHNTLYRKRNNSRTLRRELLKQAYLGR